MLTLSTIKGIIKKYKLSISAAALKTAEAKAAKLGKPLVEILINEGLIAEESFYNQASEFLKVPLINLKGREIKKDILNLIPGPVAGAHQVIAFEKDKNDLKVALADPTDIQIIEFLHRKTGLDIKPYLANSTDLKEALRSYHAELADELRVVQEATNTDSAGELKKVAEELPVINVVNSILEHAVYEGASDIHIEPDEKELVVRYRIDGILKNIMNLPKTIQNGVLARIKILSNLKIDEHMIPQDGRFKIQIQDEKLAFRVSCLPVYDGEKVVMRLLHEGAKPLSLDQLGFLDKQRRLVEQAIKKPHGMILVTGPTGSGKTTTLYSILGILNQPGVNISTVEDPIEYRIHGVNQSQVNPKAGFTFAAGLRALLRQDPNIIMVGEIRDQETADIAINAAMTGHLVLSTLHTNDAPTTLPRLIDMGIPSFLVAYTANIIMAQRLVRKLCSFCKVAYAAPKETMAELTTMFNIKKLLPLLKEYGTLQKNEKQISELTFYKPGGCRRCGDSGYKGRVGIYEILEIDEEMIKKINEKASVAEIKKHAAEHGMLTMLEDGLIKAKQGVTTITEILRVTKE